MAKVMHWENSQMNKVGSFGIYPTTYLFSSG